MADDNSAGSGGAAGAGSGGVPAGAGAGGSTPAPIALTDTSTFIPPGGKDPVSWKDFSERHVPKDELTRMRQADSARLEAERTAWQQSERQRIDQELRQQYQRQQSTTAASQKTSEFLTNLRAQPFLTGEHMAGIVEQTIVPLATALPALRQEYSQGFKMVMDQIQTIQKSLGMITGKHAEGEFSNLLSATRTKLNLPDRPIVHELLQDVYHSHTGWENDPQAYETMVAARWKDLQTTMRELDRQTADEARRTARVPGAPAAGGVARASKPLVKGNESSEELANRLWPGLQPVNT